MTTQAQQDWFDHLKGLAASPDPDPDTNRTLGKRCPWCRDIFFTYQAPGREREPYRTDPEPQDGASTRETCGSPKCHDVEDSHQFRRRLAHRAQLVQHREKQTPAVPLAATGGVM